MSEWKYTNRQCCASWLVLPTVYSDALSYGEQLDKFCYALNRVIENNNFLPTFVQQMIQEYISSGAIGEVVQDIIGQFILNVKYPPEGITPAVGDGSADDTAAIQGCIDYAAEHNGVAVYFPSGSYLTQPLTIKNRVALFGFDRYSTRVVLKGGATAPLLSGSASEISISGITLDANMDIQVNNIDLVDINVGSGIITNAVLTDGYDVLKVTVANNLQLSDVIIDSAVVHSCVLDGAGRVNCNNVFFNRLSTLNGEAYIVLNTSDSVLHDLHFIGAVPSNLIINGDRNNVTAMSLNSAGYDDNGTYNSVKFYGKHNTESYSGKYTMLCESLSESVSGTASKTANVLNETVTGTATKTAQDLVEKVTGTASKTANVLNEAVAGTATKNAQDLVEKVTGTASKTANVLNETVTGAATKTAQDLTENVSGTASKTANVLNETVTSTATKTAQDLSENVSGTASKTANVLNETVTGTATKTAQDLTENVAGTATKKANILNETVTGKVTKNYGDVTTKAFTELHSVTNLDFTATNHIGLSSAKINMGNPPELIKAGVKGLKNLFYTIDGLTPYNIITDVDLASASPQDYTTPEAYGALGDGVTDDTAAIQAAINSRKAVIFTHGNTYLLGSELQLLSGTYIDGRGAHIKASDNFAPYTNFMMARNHGYDSTVGGYEQNADITIKNLTFNANLRPLVGGIGIGHAHNVVIQGCEFYNWASWHPIELNSTLNGVVSDCYFHDMPKDGEEYGECLQIDIAHDASVFNLSPFDDTPCRNILICNNRFELNPALQNKYNVQPACIGSHTTDGTNNIEHMSSNIIVTDNVAYGAQTFCFATNWRNSLIANNIASNIRCGVYSHSWDRLTVIGNEFYFIIAEDIDGIYNRGIYTNAENELVHGNVSVINNILERTLSHAIALSGDVVTIQGNVIKYPNYAGIYASWNAGFTSVIGNTVTGESETYYGIYVNPNSNTTPITYVNGNTCEKLNAVGISNAKEKSVIANNIIRKSATINSVFVRTGNIVNGVVDS